MNYLKFLSISVLVLFISACANNKVAKCYGSFTPVNATVETK